MIDQLTKTLEASNAEADQLNQVYQLNIHSLALDVSLLLVKIGYPDRAMRILRDRLEVCGKTDGKQSPRYAEIRFSLASIARQTNNDSEAETHLELASSILSQSNEPGLIPAKAISRRDLALVRYELGKIEIAEVQSVLAESLSQLTNSLGATHAECTKTEILLARLEVDTNRHVDALARIRKVNDFSVSAQPLEILLTGQEDILARNSMQQNGTIALAVVGRIENSFAQSVSYTHLTLPTIYSV